MECSHHFISFSVFGVSISINCLFVQAQTQFILLTLTSYYMKYKSRDQTSHRETLKYVSRSPQGLFFVVVCTKKILRCPFRVFHIPHQVQKDSGSTLRCTLRIFPALAFTADFPPVAPEFHQRTHRVRLRNLGTTDKKSSRKIKYKKIPGVH